MPEPDGAHARTADEVVRSLNVDPARGLDTPEVRRRLHRHGPNRLRQARARSGWAILADQFRSLIVALLAAALLLALVTQDWLEAVAIGVVIVINAAIGFVSELRAVRSMESLRQLGRATAVVRRDGGTRHVPAEALVPGDIVIIEGGDVITADVRLIEASKLQVDESVLTGESAPVDKQIDPRPADTLLAERTNMLFKGTAVTRGSALGVVAATGMGTELGRISELTEAGLDRGRTPLEIRLDQLGRSLVWLTLVLTALVAGAGLLSGRPPLLIAKTSIALAVAAVPEGLPIVATLALARGMWRMAKRNALVRRLAAVETLGATTVICADKTGTLTENRMAVVRLATASGDVEIGPDGPPPDDVTRALLEVAVLCNNARLPDTPSDDRRSIGDPMEIALLEMGARGGVDRGDLETRMPELREVAFDPDIKMMATYHPADDGVRVCVKGAPEAVLAAATAIRTADGVTPLQPAERDAWLERNERLAGDGLRVLAFATARVPVVEAEPYADLTLLGLAGIVDPPRADVPGAVTACREAGVRVVMLTGDQAATARNIGRRVGLLDRDDALVVGGRELGDVETLPDAERSGLRETAIFARVSPRQKLDLIRLYQAGGDIVAMTGDGVNDAPALKSADIGVAMGHRGTDVAREAADMVLRDDAFPTIIAAIAQGRVIFDNIRAFIRYLISCNISEILVVFLAAVANLPLPMLPLQILFLNLVTDVFPALALGFGEGDAHVMDRLPRDPADPIVNRRLWIGIAWHGLLLAVTVLGALLAAVHWLGLDEQRAVTVSFLTLAFAQLWHVFNIRHADSGLFLNEVTRNPFVWGALGLCTGLLIAAVYVPPVAAALSTVDPGPAGWGLVAAASLLPLVIGQLVLIFGSLYRTRSASFSSSPSANSVEKRR